ncbi:MAG: tetraacyldisaccharide 4'-kinase [Gemmatimonadota bacterium]
MTPEDIWYGSRPLARAARFLLWPAEQLYRSVITARNALHDIGWLPVHDAAIPSVVVGNLSVGGTGKTPFSAWLVAELARRGGSPVLVTRGHGDDEVAVHGLLNPTVPVIVDGVRERAMELAAQRGHGVAVLDDGFQYRKLVPTASIVLVDAERWRLTTRCLPAGPLREPRAGLRRAWGVVITIKTAGEGDVALVEQDLATMGIRNVARARLRLDGVAAVGPDLAAAVVGGLSTLSGLKVLAVSGVGNREAYERQLSEHVAGIESAGFPDHHRFSLRDAADLSIRAAGADAVVCTLKDAVKLAPLWPRNGPRLLYVSQRVEIEGGEWLQGLLDRLSASRGAS